jgi:hypothetical protein
VDVLPLVGGDSGFPNAATLVRQQSENKFQGQLNVEWLTRTDTRRAIVVADGVGDLIACILPARALKPS